MQIHITEGWEAPKEGTTVRTNCDKLFPFSESVDADWEDGRVCERCLEIHRLGRANHHPEEPNDAGRWKTFAFIHNGVNANTYTT